MLLTNIYKSQIISYIRTCQVSEDCKSIESTFIKRVTTSNPSIEELIFYHIKHNNIKAVKHLLENEHIDINQSRNLDGDTFLSYALQYSRYNIVDILLMNHASRDMVNQIDITNAYGECCNCYLSYKMFYLIWQDVKNFSFLEEQLFKCNYDYEILLNTLVCDTRNFSKIKFLLSRFGDQFKMFVTEYADNKLIPLNIEHLLTGKYSMEHMLKKRFHNTKKMDRQLESVQLIKI